jgi:hypothetical protein
MDVDTPPHDPAGNLMMHPILLNPAMMNLAYDWPVQRIGMAYRPRKPHATYLLVYRDGHDIVQFSEINPVTARLLTLLSGATTDGETACRQIATEFRQTSFAQTLAFGARLLDELRVQGIVLGTSSDTRA